MLGSARGFYSLSLTQLQLSFLSLRAGLARVAVGARGLGRVAARVAPRPRPGLAPELTRLVPSDISDRS